MKKIDVVLMVVLSAIWGASFMFMRYLAPLVGPVVTADGRLLSAGVALVAFLAVAGTGMRWRERWGRYLVVGALNSGLPFLLYSYASLSLPAGVESVINALSPAFGAICGAIWLDERLGLRKVTGMLLGVLGVALVGGLDLGNGGGASLLPVLACVGATACYGLGGTYIKKKTGDIQPGPLAAGSQLLAGLAMMPLAAAFPPPRWPGVPTLAILAVFGLLCSAVAYVIYFRLIADVGPMKALAVTFLIPIFGFLWGALILGEAIAPRMALGAVVILAGTYLVVARGRGGSRRGKKGSGAGPGASPDFSQGKSG